MKFSELNIQTLREAPKNARTPGFAWLVRAGYLTRANELTALGLETVSGLHLRAQDRSLLPDLGIKTIGSTDQIYFEAANGPDELIHCLQCGYAARRDLARFKKIPFSSQPALPLEKVATPECSTIEALATFLSIPEYKTAKALMFTRRGDGSFVFVFVRGDMQLSEAKLRAAIGEVTIALPDAIERAGAVAGYASPIGLRAAHIIVDDLIPLSPNLVAGANEAGFHLRNTNYERDYRAELIADLTLASAQDACANCGSPLSEMRGMPLRIDNEYQFTNILFALAETCHDDKGLMLPPAGAPFDIYLMHIAGREIDTRSAAESLYERLQAEGFRVLFDDREARPGVKFNDADLIGLPWRITLGEKNLAAGMVELKARKTSDVQTIPIDMLKRKLTEAQ